MASNSIPQRMRLPLAAVSGLVEGQHLRLQQLQLQRHQQPVLRPARPQPHEAFARHEHLARHHGLQPVEIGQPVGIGLVGPGEPEPLHAIPQVRILDQRRGLDPVADEVAAKASQAFAA